MSKYKENRLNVALRDFQAGCKIVSENTVFSYLIDKVNLKTPQHFSLPKNAYAVVTQNGDIYVNTSKREEPEVWARIVAHCILHLAFGHFVQKERQDYWNMACDLTVEKFLNDFKCGRPFYAGALPSGITNEEKLYERFLQNGVPKEYVAYGTCDEEHADMMFEQAQKNHWGYYGKMPDYPVIFANALSAAVKDAVDIAGGVVPASGEKNNKPPTIAERAREWFISSFPLLGAIATNFKIIEDQILCHRMEITTAAIPCDLKEIYINPLAKLSFEECKFIMAHEFLHAALSHNTRAQWRDAFFWNVACDFVINMWLTQMQVGERPNGVLYDEKYKDMSAEAVYDDIMLEVKANKYYVTLRGTGLGDIMPSDEKWYTRKEGSELDKIYRRAIEEGLSFYENHNNRGYLPEGLIEEIRALNHVPIPWDAQLARWFDEMFVPLEKKRTYARVSRRQSSTPNIPRASYVYSEQGRDGRVFGVVLDTSGSMDRHLLAKCLGAIASYSVSKEVTAVRVVFCDADAYDMGYMLPEDIAGSVQVKGRGGTQLQPAIELLKRAEDFPENAPMLIITDGFCEENLILYGREHAFLLPYGAGLPFSPKGKVFRVSE